MNWVDVLGTEVLNPDNYTTSPEVRGALEAFNYYIGSGENIVITGGNRPVNSTIGTGSTSTHVRGIAADIRVEGQTHLQTAIQAEQWGYFGGVGWYEEGYYDPVTGAGPHVHVDLRGNGPARWGFDRFGNDYHGFIPRHFISAAQVEMAACH